MQGIIGEDKEQDKTHDTHEVRDDIEDRSQQKQAGDREEGKAALFLSLVVVHNEQGAEQREDQHMQPHAGWVDGEQMVTKGDRVAFHGDVGAADADDGSGEGSEP